VDFREIFFDTDEEIRHYFGQDDPEAERAQWRTLFTSSNAILYKDSPEVVEVLNHRHGCRSQSMRFCTYCCDDFLTRQPDMELLNSPEPPRSAVFAGGLHGTSASHGYSHHLTILDAAQAVTKAGLDFTIFNASDRNGQGFELYSERGVNNPRYSYRFAVSNDHLGDALMNYELGWNLMDFRLGVETRFCFHTLFGTKLYAYLDAGLPVIVSRETRFVAKFVEEHGIGITMDWEELDIFSQIVKATDWQAIRANVARVRQEHSMARQFPKILDFYNQVLGRKAFSSTTQHAPQDDIA